MRLARKVLSIVLLISMMLCNVVVPVNFAIADTGSIGEASLTDKIIINQIYGDGGDYGITGAHASHSFVELYNPTNHDVSLNGWSLQYRPNLTPTNTRDAAYTKLDLQGTIPSNSSFLVRGAAAIEPENPTNLVISQFDQEWSQSFNNKGVEIVLLNNTTLLNSTEVTNPFNTDGAGTKVPGYVDMIGVAGNDSGENDFVDGYETSFSAVQSKKKALRRIDFQDSDNNVTDFEVIDYSNSDNVDSAKPHCVADGAWLTGGGGSDIDAYAATEITFAPGKNATELNLAWYSNDNSQNSAAVQVAKKANMTGDNFPANKAITFTGTTSSAITGFLSNKVTVTNLQESTEYVYRVGDGSDANWSSVYNFSTQNPDTYSFLAVGDPQIGSSGSVVGDTNGWKDTLSKALAEFEDVSFLLSLGDQVESNSNETEYTGFFAPSELRSLPVAPLVGNHDNGAPNYSYHYNLPNLSSQYGITTNTSSDYYFTYGDTLIMVLNSNNTSGATHAAFIDEAVAANPNAIWKVAMFHHDIYGSGGHAAEIGIKNLRQALFPVFDQYDVDLVLTGHDHSYTRTYQMYNDQPLPGQNSIGTVYMTLNSGSGSKYYDLQATPETYAAKREQIKVPTFTKYDVTANSLTISTYRTDTMAMTDTYTIMKEAQEVLDLAEVTVTADGSTLDAENPAASIALSVTAKDSNEAAVDLTGAYVLYKTAEPDILSMATDGKVTVKNAPGMNETIKVWTEVYDGSKFIKSNELNVNVTVPIGLAEVTLAANGTSISTNSSESIKLSLTGKDTTGADMSLSSATVEYKTDKADIFAIAADGTVTVQNAPERNTDVKITADVTIDGKKVTSNALAITVIAGAGTEIIVPVNNALDDIEERANGTLDFDSSDLEIVKEKPGDTASQLIGIRFVDLAIPKGATITDAYIQFSVDEVNKDIDPFNVHIHAEDAANSDSFIDDGQDPSTATHVVSDKYAAKTAESVEWNDAPSWTTEHEVGTAEQTPNLASLVQKIVDKTGWNSGNAISFLLSGEGRRIAESFDGSGNDSEKPTLHVNYVEVDPSISISAARALATGETTTVTGIVTCVNPTTVGSYFIQDSTAGVCVYNPSLSPAPQLGDKIQVNGVIGSYKGLLEIMPESSADVIIKTSGNPISEPQIVTIDEYPNYQSQLVKIKDVTLGTINNGGNTTVTDDSGKSTVIYKIPQLTGISAGDKVDIIAISASYNTPQLIVPSAADIVKSAGTVDPSDGDKIFDILEITDLHGNIGNDTNNQIAAVLAENMKKVKADNPNRTLILAAGDNYQGTAISNLQYGEPVMEIFNYLGVAASALGNHEFDWGLDKVTNIDPAHPVVAQYPIVCANLFPEGNTTDPVFDPYKIFTLDGVKIAVVGGITETTPGIVMAGYIEDYDVLSNVTYINKYSEQARTVDGAQIVIALIHEGGDPLTDIAKNLIGVDAVLGGHTHTSLSTTVTTTSGKSIPVVIANANGKGYIDLKAILHEDGSLTFANAETAYIAQDTTSTVYPYGYKATTPTVDLAVKQIIADTMTEEGPILGEILGSAQKNITRNQVVSPYGESLAGNWATDIMRSESNADFAFQNNGGLRCEIPQGAITMSKIYEFMPFDNVIMTCDMTGAQLKVILEEAVADGGKGIQLSGLDFLYDSSKPSGSRVYSIVKSDGTAVNLNNNTTTYKVATNDFMAGGTTAVPKDGFSFASQSSNMMDTHILVRDALADAVRDAGAAGITASIGNRMKNQPAATTGPDYRSVSINNAKIVTITFSDSLESNVADLKEAVSFASDGTNYQPLGSNDTVVIQGNSLEITFANELAGNANRIKIAANVLKNETGNVQTKQIVTDTFDATIDECFIATASFGSKFQPSVVLLRNFRDKFLLTNPLGVEFVKFYYHNSPPIAKFIAGNEALKNVVRILLTPFVVLVYFLFNPILLVLSLVLLGMAVMRIKRRKALAVE